MRDTVPEADRKVAKLHQANNRHIGKHEHRGPWLKSLKAGDQVAVTRNSWGLPTWTIYVVLRRTKTQLVLALASKPDTEAYRASADTGRIRGSGGQFRSCVYIDPVCPGVRYHNRRAELVRQFGEIDTNTLTNDDLEAIVSVVAKRKEKSHV